MQTRYVVDTNIMTAWLLNPEGASAKIIRSRELELFTPIKAIDELWEHRAEWSKKRVDARLSEFTSAIGFHIRVLRVNQNSKEMKTALQIMEKIDPDDSEFLAAALRVDAEIWSRDKHFTKQSKVGVVTTEELVKRAVDHPGLWLALHGED